ncbi:27794_t:CDS:1, partial [Dentiscutata erythropus]
PETVKSLRGVVCLERAGRILGVVVGNSFTDGAVDEAEKSSSYPIILTTMNHIHTTFLNLTLDITTQPY